MAVSSCSARRLVRLETGSRSDAVFAIHTVVRANGSGDNPAAAPEGGLLGQESKQSRLRSELCHHGDCDHKQEDRPDALSDRQCIRDGKDTRGNCGTAEQEKDGSKNRGSHVFPSVTRRCSGASEYPGLCPIFAAEYRGITDLKGIRCESTSSVAHSSALCSVGGVPSRRREKVRATGASASCGSAGPSP